MIDRNGSPRAWCALLLVALLAWFGCGDIQPPSEDEPSSAKPISGRNDSAAVPSDSSSKTEEATAKAPDHSAADVTTGEAASHGQTPHKANRLASETSPYLLLHAHNPVDWYPWGDEAFAKAKREGKLVFLSIGYSSCYWCHVMERESFMNDEIAALLNANFVAIKVDREERPDIDEIYMTALQAMNGQGGWPLSMFLTPDAEPIVGGTYFPPRTTGGRKGFPEVLGSVLTAWQEHRDSMEKQADLLTEHVRKSLRQTLPASGDLRLGLVDATWEALAESYDPEYGGFGFSATNPSRPKFPEPANLVFLLHLAEQDEPTVAAREMLLFTLEKMAQGGIYDHVGGGFHRYSTDRFWHVPHFEKMLYDNAQLAGLYAAAGEFAARDDFRRTARGIVEFVLREMTDEQGAFYSALDAETDAVEGKFYLWTQQELKAGLSPDEWNLLAPIYGLAGEPNYEEHYVLQLAQPLAAKATERGIAEDFLLAELRPGLDKLFSLRSQRKRPLTDTKILTSWNGLMIEGLADAGRLLEEPRYIEAAERAAEFALTTLRVDGGRLLRTYSGGEAKLNGYLDDYAFLTAGLIALDRATGDQKWRVAAVEITEKQIELFADAEHGGFFYTSSDHEALIARSKDPADGVIPAGNSVSARNLIYLAQVADRDDFRKQAEATLRAQLGYLERSPAMMPLMSVALDEWLRSAESKR